MSLYSFLKFFFPPVCVACDEYAPYFCKKCQNEIDFLYYQPRIPLLTGLVSQFFILGFYTPPLSKVIKALKYDSLWPIAEILGELLYQHVPLPPTIDLVTAVPLHPKRLAVRGYNQAERIARSLAHRLGKPYTPLLLRQQHAQNLASTHTGKERRALTAHAFSIHPTTINIQGKNILIVDDVITTGATLAGCATILKTLRPKHIFVAALAHEG